MPTSRMPRLVSTLRTPGHRRGVVVRRAIAVAPVSYTHLTLPTTPYV